MELKDFVSNSIVQICEGIKDAQTKTEKIGACVSPRLTRDGAAALSNVIAVGSVSTITFDIATEAVDESRSNNTTKTEGTINVLGSKIGMNGNKQREENGRNSEVSRLQFAVNVFWPSITLIDPGFEGSNSIKFLQKR